jgi:phosphate transport system substrate-binding protein
MTNKLALLTSSIVLFLLIACGGNTDKKAETQTSNKVVIDGSSTVFPITEAVAEEFRLEKPDVRVTIGVSGTGGGFKKFTRGELDIANASRPIKKVEDSTCTANGIEYIELPIAYDGIAIVTHKDNTWLNDITVSELKVIWEPSAQGKITRWNQIRPTWPDQEMHLMGAGTQSGTFEYFTEAIIGKSKSCRGDYTASEDDNVLVQGVATDKSALAFFGIDYYIVNKDKLKLIPVNDENENNGKGAIAPNEETVKNGTYQPLSRPLFIYINKKTLQKEEVNAFASFYMKHASELVSEVGYIPLSKEAYTMITDKLEKQLTGSVFLKLKSTVGVRMEDIVNLK